MLIKICIKVIHIGWNIHSIGLYICFCTLVNVHASLDYPSYKRIECKSIYGAL